MYNSLEELIRVLIIDDSAFMRKSLSILLESDSQIKVIGTARDGLDGYTQAMKLKPDLITLDIEMPKMDGLTALKKIMTDCPTPVIMVSSLTSEGAEATIKAMELGAVDFIPKEMSFVSVNITKIKDDLIRKVKAIIKQNKLKNRILRLQAVGNTAKKTASVTSITRDLPIIPYKALAIGISTGGPFALQKVIPQISDKINCPVFVVQHMPPKFTKSLADRLNGMSKLEVKEADDGELVKNNTVYIAPGGRHLKVNRYNQTGIRIEISDEPKDSLNKPSVDVMLSSVNKAYGKYTLGVIMTGMGRDGLEGITELKNMGGHAIAQDEESCVVYGMPKAIVDAGLADMVLPIEKIPIIINKVIANER
jgi:two-component system chemotaxis response regulator CheB